MNEQCDCRGLSFAESDTFADAVDIVLSEHVAHRYYHHYTTLDRVLKMICSRRWVLTRCTCLAINDLQEPKKFNDASNVLGKTYIACFGHGTTESAAMWGLYGKSNPFALRIIIPREKMSRWMQEIEFVKGRCGESRMARKALSAMTFDSGRSFAVEPVSAVFGDLVYVAVENDADSDDKRVQRSHVVRWEDAKCHCDDDDLAHVVRKYPGWIKDIEWYHEKESRLCVRLDKPIKAERISIRIPDYVIEDMRFTLSPWLDKSLEDIVKEVVGKAIGSTRTRSGRDRIRKSVLRGALNFK